MVQKPQNICRLANDTRFAEEAEDVEQFVRGCFYYNGWWMSPHSLARMQWGPTGRFILFGVCIMLCWENNKIPVLKIEWE